MKITCGTDLIEIERLEGTIRRHGPRFLNRVFTPAELAEVGFNSASLAARFAAKEAVSKALGTGIGDVSWQEIEILRSPNQQPQLHLHGAALALAAQQGWQSWSISLSHSQTHAIAFIVALSDN